VADFAEAAMAVTTTTVAIATAGLLLPCTPIGTPETTLPTGTPGITRRPPGTTTMVGAAAGAAAGATLPTDLRLRTAAGREGSGLGRCLTPRTGCPREAMVAAVPEAVAMTGEVCLL
jgi:hypothetical protein